MAGKLQYYSDLAETAVGRLTQSRESWANYLATAARLYKYPFHEQAMIYTQRPNATAVASVETWNKAMNRYPKYGSSGIALIKENAGKTTLSYVFDVSDTSGRNANAKEPFLWEMKPEYEEAVIKSLGDKYGVIGENGSLAGKLCNIAQDLVHEYYYDNEEDINSGDDFLEIAAVSTAYSLLKRCGLNADEYFSDSDFRLLGDFKSFEEITALGTAVSKISEKVLRDIEITIKNYEKNKQKELGLENGKNDNDRVRSNGRLSNPEYNLAGTAGNRAARQIRADAPELSNFKENLQFQLALFCRKIYNKINKLHI